eukprot:CCRYP_017446-RA/>CCRYP_017446-RA protein AED:0.44 eAED:0.44 QI:0/-1/0/1/-1/1/1/0/181
MPACVSHHRRCGHCSRPGMPRGQTCHPGPGLCLLRSGRTSNSKIVDEIWYRDLRHDRSFYTHVTAKQLLSHLDDNCGGLHPSKLVNLPTNMLGFYTTADGIPEYINMLEAAQRKLARANLPMSDDQLLAIASTAILASNHFPRPTDDWEAKPRPTTVPPTSPESVNSLPLELPCHPRLPTP